MTRAFLYGVVAAVTLKPSSALLWFADAPNNLGDMDGLTTADGTFWLRYNNGACEQPYSCPAGAGGHCPMGIKSYGIASSPDGVHWTDHGSTMHPFDEGRNCPNTGSGSGSIWRGSKAAARRYLQQTAGANGTDGTNSGDSGDSSDAGSDAGSDDMFVINYSHDGIIRFMTAPSPKGPWTPVGPNTTAGGGFGPGRKPARPQDGTQFYDGRWDTANGWPAPDPAPGGFRHFAWITATSIEDPKSSVGHMGSVDGVNWTALPPATVTNWGGHTLTGGPMEQGGCAYAANVRKWYCFNGFRGNWALVDDTRGMGTFVSDSPGGPFKIAEKNALVMAYKSPYLATTSDAPTYFMRFWLRYDVADPSSPPELLVVHQSYVHSTAMTYLAPLKRAVVDNAGTLRLQYWDGNEKLKGDSQPVVLGPADAKGTRIFTTLLNNRNGTILEGTSSDGCQGSLLFFGAGNGSSHTLEVGVDEQLVMAIYRVDAAGKTRTLLDRFDRAMFAADCASGGASFRLLLRGSMAEVYVNDVLLLPIPLGNTVSAGGPYPQNGGWATGVRAPAISVGLTGSWARSVHLDAWTIAAPALFPMA